MSMLSRAIGGHLSPRPHINRCRCPHWQMLFHEVNKEGQRYDSHLQIQSVMQGDPARLFNTVRKCVYITQPISFLGLDKFLPKSVIFINTVL